MAIKELVLRKRIEEKRTALEKLQEAAKDLETREAELAAREAELEEALEEVSNDEEKAAFDEALEAYEKDKEELDTAKEENAKEGDDLQAEIEELEKELDERTAKKNEAVEKVEKTPAEKETRKELNSMIYRTFAKMTMEERTAIVEREDVKTFLGEIRNRLQNRAVANASVTIPNILVGVIYQNAEESSKLLKHVRVENVPGIARLIVDGGFPEAVWTEQCANINELNIGLYDMEVDGYKVGGYIKVCNAILEDSDIDLASLITEKLGRAIGYALDKAIVAGTGTKMPLGFATRLLQSSQPANYRSTQLAWKNLNSTNVKKITSANSTGIKLFEGIIDAAGGLNGKYSTTKFWVMNEKTKTALLTAALSINAAGAIVTGLGDQMPIIGGAIEVLDFIPDNMIFGGYEACYFLAQRAGATIDQSEHVFWLQDETAFKGTARYDGAPAIPDAFVAIGINNTDVALTNITFAADTANTEASA